MNCTCVKDMEDKLRDFLTPKIKGPIEKIECGNIAFSITDAGMVMNVYTPFNVKADAPGYRSANGKSWPVHASFCPFCGTKTGNQP